MTFNTNNSNGNIEGCIALAIEAEGSTFGTFIPETYTWNQRELLADAIDEVLSPNDTWGFASNGLYFFWDYYTKEILYIGISVDLKQRFREHNGLIQSNTTSNKFNQIQDYFSNHEKLGYTIFAQTPESQTRSSRNIHEFSEVTNYTDEINRNLRRALNIFEGLFIQQFFNIHNAYPLWNSIHSSHIGAEIANTNVLQNFEQDVVSDPESFLSSRCSIKTLSSNSMFTFWEVRLNLARSWAIYTHMNWDEAFMHNYKNSNLTRKEIYNEIIRSNYLNRIPIL